MLDKLSQSLKNTLKKISDSVFVDEKLVNELCRDIQRALLQSDVNVQLVFELTKSIKAKALKDAPKGINKKDYLVKILYDELVQFLGGEGHKITIVKKPFKIMLVGLFGSGKTTTAGKLARFYSTRGHKVAVLGLDVHRPGAMEQLQQLAQKLNIPAFIDKAEKDPAIIAKKFSKDLERFDIILIDSAGRDALSDDLIQEINTINDLLKPEENLLVLSADIGQAAETQAKAFHNACGVSGVVITKMEGTARGGGALTACAVTKAPVKFIGIGEKPEDLESFDPKRFVGRILGMGDIETLLEKANEFIDKDEAEDLGKRFLKGEYNLIDLYEQMEAMSKMGPLSKVMELVPGFSQIQMPKDMLAVQESKLKKWKFVMQSMTKKELEEPESIDHERIERISQGSGLEISVVRELLKQYRQSKKLVKMMKGMGAGDARSMERMMKKMNLKMQ